MAVVRLFFVPAAEAVTFTTKAHCALAATVAPDRETVVPLAGAVGATLQVLETSGVPVSAIFAGRLSVNPIPVSETPVLVLPMANVSVVAPFTGMLGAPKAFVNVGGA
jgi:hypothetical protein